MMLTLLLIGMLTLAFNVQPARAEPRRWIVDDDKPADFHTIQEAVNAAEGGDIIFVKKGTYYENYLKISKPLTIRGQKKSDTIIDGGGFGPVIRVLGKNVAISGFTVRNGSQSWLWETGNAIFLYYAQSCTISDNIVTNSRYGIVSYLGKGNTISGNTISDTNQGVVLAHAYNETVIENAISNGVQVGSDPPYGIQVWGAYNNTVIGNSITNISDPMGTGIELYTSYNNKVVGNTISNIGDIGIGLSHYNNTIADNTITNSTVGVYLMEGSNNNIIKGNTISNSTPGWASYGMNIYGFNNTIIGNRITNISYTGIRLNSYAPYPIKSTNNVVSGNIVSKTNQGIAAGFEAPSNTIIGNNASDNYIGLFIFDHSDDNTVINNVVSNNYYGITLFSSDDTKVYHNNFIDNTEQVLLSNSFNTLWDDDYPFGGNYWSDYTDEDLYNGPNQNVLGSDDIWDHSYVIDASNRDDYPLVHPWGPATIDIDPDTLNLEITERWITAYIELPEIYDVSEIDVSSILLNDAIPVDLEAPTEIGDYDEDGIPDLMVKFDRASVIDLLSVGEATLTITGEVNGIPFEGNDTIRVIDE